MVEGISVGERISDKDRSLKRRAMISNRRSMEGCRRIHEKFYALQHYYITGIRGHSHNTILKTRCKDCDTWMHVLCILVEKWLLWILLAWSSLSYTEVHRSKRVWKNGKIRRQKIKGWKLLTSIKIQAGTYCIYQCLISTSLSFCKIKVRLRKEQGVQFRADEM